MQDGATESTGRRPEDGARCGQQRVRFTTLPSHALPHGPTDSWGGPSLPLIVGLVLPQVVDARLAPKEAAPVETSPACAA
jgi:hypothetical protein